MRANLCDLIPDPDNVRTHSPANIRAIEGSLRAFGQRKPIVVVANGDDTYTVVAGNGTLQAATNLGWDELDIAPIPDGWTSDTIRAYALADNKTAELAAWDTVELNAQLEELTLSGFDIGDIGFDIDDVFSTEPVEDEVPEPPKDSITKLGDLWLLGEHRLLCGDSADKTSVARVTDGGIVGCVVTDPPYGISAEKMTLGSGKKEFHRGEWDGQRPDIMWVISAAPQVIIWGGNYFADKLPVTNDWLCWHKKNDGLSFSEFELAWTNLGKNCRMISHHWSGEVKAHPTMKPIAVMDWCLKFTNGNILDPFLGSGTTLIAAEQLGRVCYGMELDPAYCDVIVQRWENLTGKKATREGE